MKILLEVKVIPGSGRLDCKFDQDGNLKIYLKARPEKGAANEELIRYTAKMLKISRSQVVLRAGGKTRRKLLQLDIDIGKDELMDRLRSICS